MPRASLRYGRAVAALLVACGLCLVAVGWGAAPAGAQAVPRPASKVSVTGGGYSSHNVDATCSAPILARPSAIDRSGAAGGVVVGSGGWQCGLFRIDWKVTHDWLRLPSGTVYSVRLETAFYDLFFGGPLLLDSDSVSVNVASGGTARLHSYLLTSYGDATVDVDVRHQTVLV